MLSNYKLNKIQKEIKSLYMSGASKNKIGKYINSELKQYINKSAIIDKGVKKNLSEVNINVDMHGISQYKFKKIKKEIYSNLEKNKKIHVAKYFSNIDNTNDEYISDNINMTSINLFLNKDETKIAFLVLEFENYGTKKERQKGYIKSYKNLREEKSEQDKHYFYSVQIPKKMKSKEDIKELILQSIALNRQSGKKLRLVNISFRFFSDANTTQK